MESINLKQLCLSGCFFSGIKNPELIKHINLRYISLIKVERLVSFLKKTEILEDFIMCYCFTDGSSKFLMQEVLNVLSSLCKLRKIKIKQDDSERTWESGKITVGGMDKRILTIESFRKTITNLIKNNIFLNELCFPYIVFSVETTNSMTNVKFLSIFCDSLNADNANLLKKFINLDTIILTRGISSIQFSALSCLTHLKNLVFKKCDFHYSGSLFNVLCKIENLEKIILNKCELISIVFF